MHPASSGSNCIREGQTQTVSMIYLKLPFPSHTWGGLDYSLPHLNKTPAVFSLREAPSSGFQLPLAQRILGEERPRPPSLIFVSLLTSHLSNRRTQNPPFSEMPQLLIGLLETLFFTHQPIWDDCRQLQGILFTIKERDIIMTVARKAVIGPQ